MTDSSQYAHDDNIQDAPKQPVTPGSVIANVIRGGLIGLAELVPGISGGTIALIVGVYERLIDSANHVLTGVKRLVAGPDRGTWWREVKRAEWGLIIPLLIGMVSLVFTLAGVMEGFVTNHPSKARGLFLGMVLASVAVPLLLIDRKDLASTGKRIGAALLLLVVAVVFFFLTGLGGAPVNNDPSLVLVFFAAAVAICALVLPGVSGSFFLLTIGIYAATTGAVDDRNIVYLLVFMAGAFTGLAVFVKALHWLLHNMHTKVMLVMAGLMLGSLRALWPWQGPNRELLAPGADALPVFGLTLLGAVVVVAMVLVDRKMSAKPQNTEQTEAA